MPASTIVASGGTYRLYDDSVQTHTDLPIATYVIRYSPMGGYSLQVTEPLAPGDETVYGSHTRRVERIAAGYQAMDRSLGVILSGDKGMGKSLMIRMLAARMRAAGLATVLVQEASPGLAAFLDELGEVLVVFDEFEKIFTADADADTDHQNQFLSLFDGLSTTKRLYALSVNELPKVSSYLLNRPGRFHYHMRFEYPGPDEVATYLRDQVPGITERVVDQVVDFSRKTDINYDHLRAIVFELLRGEPFAEMIADLNIKRTERGSEQVEMLITWEDGDTDVVTGRVDLFDTDVLQALIDYTVPVRFEFRMRDTLSTSEGFVLPRGAFTQINLQGDDHDENPASDKQEEDVAAVELVLRRPAKRSLDY